MNVEKANAVKIISHEAIRTIISALGCGFREDFSLDKRRYGKIVIMTDADVDGSHIRTLLLTFFFRHMTELIRAGRVYVAQPPLYQVVRKKKSEYVLNERSMRKALTDLGLEGTQLIIRDDEGKEKSRVSGEEMRRVVDLLSKLEEVVKIIQRRGIDFAEFLARRNSAGRLPEYHVVADGEEHYFYTAAERDAFLNKQDIEADAKEADPTDGNGSPSDPRRARKIRNSTRSRTSEKCSVSSSSSGYRSRITTSRRKNPSAVRSCRQNTPFSATTKRMMSPAWRKSFLRS